MELEIYGWSDDSIMVDGDVVEQYYANDGVTRINIFGVYEILATYDGEWHFDVAKSPGEDSYEMVPVGETGKNDYTEMVVIDRPLKSFIQLVD